jgi:ribosome maturation protein Sdo1
MIQMKVNQVVQALYKQEKIKVAQFQIAVKIVVESANTSNNKSSVIILCVTW